MQIQRNSIYFVRVILDFILLSIIYFASIQISKSYSSFEYNINIVFIYLVNLFIWFAAAKSFGLYDEYRGRDLSFEIIALLKTIFVQSVSAIIVLFFLKEASLSRAFVIAYSFGLFLVLSLEKFILRRLLYQIRVRGKNLRSLLIVGAGEVGKSFVDAIEENPHFGYKVVGFLDDEIKTFLNGQYLGNIENLDRVLSEKRIDNVVVALPNYATEKLENVVRICNKHTTRVKIIPDYFKFVSSKYNVSMFGPFPVISVREDRVNEFHWRLLKRAFDTTFSFFLFTFIFSWFWPIIAIAIKLDSKGPVFFKQERWGRDNKKFFAYKFRSMVATSKDVDEKGKYQQASKDDPRITRIGKILRKTNLDELPQFLNVLKGEMSIVGPRPHPIPLNKECMNNINLYMIRHLVKPGITGWAQVNGYRGETKESILMQKRVDHDIWYIENWSFLLDIQIIIKTVWNMVKGDPNAY